MLGIIPGVNPNRQDDLHFLHISLYRKYIDFPYLVWRQSQEKKKNAAKKNAEEKKDDSNNSGKSKTGTSNIKSDTKAQQSTKDDEETEVVELDGSKDENKENEDEDSDEIQEIPIS